jgi:hypothetical protein
MNEPDFQKHAQDEFRFLIESCGFAHVSSEPQRVRFFSNEVMVEVNYSGRGEIDVILDENPPSHRFQFRLFLKAYHPEVETALGCGIANCDDEVRRELNLFADVLERYGQPLLEHDVQVFAKMKTFKWWEQTS